MQIKSKLFNDEQVQFILDNYYGTSTYKLADLINELFGLNVTRDQVKNFLTRNKLSNGLATSTQFKKGHVPFNKGEKMSDDQYEKCKDTMFKAGSIPPNRREIGDERLDKDGYIYVKVADGQKNKNWKAKHHIVYESVHGPIPPQHKVVFLDGNTRNFDIDNLACVSNGVHAIMCKNKRYLKDAELTETNILITKVENTINSSINARHTRTFDVFTDEIKEFIYDHAKTLRLDELTDAVNKKFGGNYSKRQIKNLRGRMGIKTGLPRGGKKGNKPWNTGLKYDEKMKAKTTTFQSGNTPFNTAPIGTERFYDGCIQVKVTDEHHGKDYQKNWIPKARLVWEQYNGPLKESDIIIHLDGDKRNLDISNLSCVSRAELIRMNKNHRYSEDGEITKAGVLVSKIEQEMYKKKKEKK